MVRRKENDACLASDYDRASQFINALENDEAKLEFETEKARLRQSILSGECTAYDILMAKIGGHIIRSTQTDRHGYIKRMNLKEQKEQTEILSSVVRIYDPRCEILSQKALQALILIQMDAFDRLGARISHRPVKDPLNLGLEKTYQQYLFDQMAETAVYPCPNPPIH